MVTRVGGLASGMDIDSIVEKLMVAERTPLNKLKQKKTSYEWQRDAYRSVNTKLKTLDSFIFDNYRLTGSLSSKTATVSDSSKVSVIASAAAQGNLSISDVGPLATAAKITGGDVGNVALTQRLAKADTDSLQTMMGAGAPAELKFDILGTNAQNITIDTTKSIKDVLTQLNASGTGLNAAYNSTTGKFSFATTTGNTIDFNDAGSKTALSNFGMDTTKTSGTFTSATKWIAGNASTASSSTKLGEYGLTNGTFKISAPNANGATVTKDISYSATDTIDSLLTKINSSGVGVTSLVGSNGAISLTANNTGTGTISFTAIDPNLKSILTDNDPLKSKSGTDVTYVVNGVEMTSRSNQATVSGYNVTFKGEIDSIAGDAPVSISSSASKDGIYDKIKTFIDTYNGLIADLSGQIKQTKYRDFAPLTDDQKKDMSDDEIKLWEEKAKSGLLRGDSIIRDGLSDLRSQFVNSISGLSDTTKDSFAEIGITTSKSWNDGGKLVIDDTKLRAAIEKNPDQVISMFTKTGEKTKVGNDTVDTRGIAQRLRDSLEGITKNIEKKAGKTTHTDYQYTIGKNMVNLNTRIGRLEDRLADVEKRYWKQFTAMEKAINKANMQSSYFNQSAGQ